MKTLLEILPVVLIFVGAPAWQMWQMRRSIKGWHLVAYALVAIAAVCTFYALLPAVRRGGWEALLPLFGVLAAGAVALGAASFLVFGALFMLIFRSEREDAPARAEPSEREPRSLGEKLRLGFRIVVLVVLPVASLFGVRDATVRTMVWAGVGAVVLYFVWVIFIPRDDDIRTRRRAAPGRRSG
jgi:hypothetical protein